MHFIELYWPKLLAAFNGRKSVRTLQAVIANAAPGAEGNWQYKHLMNHTAVMREFLRSRRYHGEPRQIAYAIAGLPELAWRSSFDYGTKNPSLLHITLPAFADHIRRHNRVCFEKLQADGITQETLKLLRSCCAECRRLATKPERLPKALRAGLQ